MKEHILKKEQSYIKFNLNYDLKKNMVKYKNIIQTIEDYLTKHPINEKARNIGKTGKWTTQTNEKGEIIAKMDVNDCGRFIQTIIPPNSSIGPHLQESN
ncbi:MAG: hypothetical protein IKS93_03075, partial [Methanobrevibacter sp.]|nr:hypothetical protein [Methanobrevibacter sp.]